MKNILHNIQVGQGKLTATFQGGTPVKGTYSINEHDEVTLESLEVVESDGSFELSADQIDFEELEEVISMRLGNFPSKRALEYGGAK